METMMIGGGFGGLFWLIILGLVIWVMIENKTSSTSSHGHEKSALDILDESYASGQIEREAYLQKKQDLSHQV